MVQIPDSNRGTEGAEEIEHNSSVLKMRTKTGNRSLPSKNLQTCATSIIDTLYTMRVIAIVSSHGLRSRKQRVLFLW